MLDPGSFVYSNFHMYVDRANTMSIKNHYISHISQTSFLPILNSGSLIYSNYHVYMHRPGPTSIRVTTSHNDGNSNTGTNIVSIHDLTLLKR